MTQDAVVQITERLLEIVAALVALVGLKWKFGSGNTNEKELFRQLEKKDTEIMQLKIELEGWKRHHAHLTQKPHLH